MFTGLIQQVGSLKALETSEGGKRLIVDCDEWHPPLTPGESIAVSGVCLTVCRHDKNMFACDVLLETLDKTTLGLKRPGSSLNLERALTAGGAMGGHMVTGHVDGRGTVARRVAVGRDLLMRIRCPRALTNCMVQKGSVACDGVSLTIARVSGDDGGGEDLRGRDGFFEIHLAPFTLSHTSLGKLKPGDAVNIETDIIEKYVNRQGTRQRGTSGITMERLRDAGFE